MPINLFCLLIFTLPVTKILLCKVGTFFSLNLCHSMARDSMKLMVLVPYGVYPVYTGYTPLILKRFVWI